MPTRSDRDSKVSGAVAHEPYALPYLYVFARTNVGLPLFTELPRRFIPGNRASGTWCSRKLSFRFEWSSRKLRCRCAGFWDPKQEKRAETDAPALLIIFDARYYPAVLSPVVPSPS